MEEIIQRIKVQYLLCNDTKIKKDVGKEIAGDIK